MRNKNNLIGIMVAIIVAVYYFFIGSPYNSYYPESDMSGATQNNFLATPYLIEGREMTVRNQVVDSTEAGSDTVAYYFGDDSIGDLNGDGVPDHAFLITTEGGGSGTFYYVVVAFTNGNGYVGSNAVFLGDRIAPQNTRIENGQLIVNYADRSSDEPMTVAPSIGKSMYLDYENGSLIEARPKVGLGEHCGGNMMNAPACASNLHCAPVKGSHLPMGDVGGVCVAD